MKNPRESRKGNLHVPTTETQWKKLRDQIPEAGAILLVRLGDYYESFYEDSEIVSGVSGHRRHWRGTYHICGFPLNEIESVKLNLTACKIRIFLTEDRTLIEEIF